MDFVINSSVATFSGSQVLDPTTNKKFQENVDKIKDVKITKISYTISDFNGPDTQTASVSLDFADASGNNKQNFGALSNVILKVENGNEKFFNLNNAQLAAMAALFKTPPNKFTIYNSGSFNQAPAKFKMKLKFYNEYEVKIFPLN
ncbi:MAG: hypothetical protein CFE22_16220 [Cytophagaceae bacterium BCCC1]|nr:MAG: hypothetical protein CFE22_16220 [Cytophagaceae bacterium BCCC1]